MQALDASADHLAHRRAHLPELTSIATLRAERARLVDALRDAHIVVDDLVAEQEKVDADVEQVKARRARDTVKLEQGLVPPKDLERLQHELTSLERRIGALEDDELEVMAQVEDAQRTLSGLEAELGTTEDQLAAHERTRDEAFAQIDEEAAGVARDREAAAAGLPDDLMALYTRLRDHKGGVGASELRLRQCGGCQLGIDNAELSRIRALPAEEVVRCEECTRILVRTEQSGL